MVFHGFHPIRNVLVRIGIRERMILQHARWLTWAMRHEPSLPRIPVRKVSEGGFARLMSTPAGRYTAERWWDRALERMESRSEN